MKIFKKQLVTMSLLSLLAGGLTGCERVQDDTLDLSVTPFMFEKDFEESSLSLDKSVSLDNDHLTDEVEIISIDTVIANSRTEIYEDLSKKNILGYLPEGKSLDLIEMSKDGYYKVDYYGDEAYVNEKKVSLASVYDIKSPMKRFLYATENTKLVIPSDLTETGQPETVDIPKFECFEVYDENDALYLVKTEDNIGYISKSDVKELDGTIVVVDISKQKLTLYKDNEIIIECPVVTGTPTASRQTDIGAWEIYDISYNRPLIGPGYSSPVDIMMKFNGGEGLHDAEYHTCDFWKKKGRNRHGWRDEAAFGGDTYLNNGSHGCVNMRHDDVFYVREFVDIGTPVIVKK